MKNENGKRSIDVKLMKRIYTKRAVNEDQMLTQKNKFDKTQFTRKEKEMSRKNLFKLGALGAVVAILCMFSSMPAHAQTLKLGTISPLSGPGAPWG